MHITPFIPRLLILVCVAGLSLGCGPDNARNASSPAKGSYGYDADFLKKHLNHVTELTNDDGARVLITGDYQGRVMTSSASGENGNSFGWINYDLVRSGEKVPQFNPVGGEERFWIGPEGGQYSFYFGKGNAFEFENWQVPPFIDTLSYAPVSSGPGSVTFSHTASIENYHGSKFDLEVNRTIRLLNNTALSEKIHGEVPDKLKWVAYETENTVKNTGSDAWTEENGLLSVWLLGMFISSDETVAIIPFKSDPGAKQHITDDYFGPIPPDRLVVRDSLLLFKCDGNQRGKLGLSPAIAQPVAGSFDYRKNILTLILFTVDPAGRYVNSRWKIQDNPYEGDVVNAYNDGPLESGGQMGPFYELESSSTAIPLQAGESFTYRQVTCHFEGEYSSLDILAQRLLGISLDNARLTAPGE